MEGTLTQKDEQVLSFVSKLIEERGILQEALVAIKIRLSMGGDVDRKDILDFIETALEKAS